MSGDQILKKQLVKFEIYADHNKNGDIVKIPKQPINIVTSYGLEIESTLNPNALEFYPAYMQNKTQNILNTELKNSLTESKEKTIVENGIKQEFKIKELNEEKEQFERDLKFIQNLNVNKNDERVGMQGTSEIIQNDGKEEKEVDVIKLVENKTTNKGENIEINPLYVLFSSSSKVDISSSETDIHERESKNLLIDNKKENFEKEDHCNIPDDIKTEDKKYNESNIDLEPSLEQSILKVNNLEKESLTPEVNEKHDKDVPNFEINVKQEIETAKESVGNVKDRNKTEVTKSYPKNSKQRNENVSKEVTDLKKNVPLSPDIKKPPVPAAGTIKKINTTPTPIVQNKELKNMKKVPEPKKDIKPKTATCLPPTAPQLNLAKSSKNNLAIKTNFSSKSNDSSQRAPAALNGCTKIKTTFNRDTVSNRSSSSTEKSTESNRSSAPKNINKSTGKPAGLGIKASECLSKSPRATVSSKLRKTETQKRRNLFFDLDTIKMTEFLFK